MGGIEIKIDMEYKLIEQYFDTEIFQNITQLYFDTVLQDLLVRYPITEAKGLFVIDDKVRKDDYALPYSYFKWSNSKFTHL
ncbi:MAG: hypothetical protein JJE17_03125 [Peptostreptococcaceae bacterium]|nr:hypothetical protein [Peptostreptococcaceae bacterium]